MLTYRLIAVMLGRLRMSVAYCITAYLKLSERVFRQTRHQLAVTAKVQGRFDSDELARAVKEVATQQGLPEDALLKDEPNAACKVYVDPTCFLDGTLTPPASCARRARRPARRSA